MTKEDINLFKQEMLDAFRTIVEQELKPRVYRKWIKTYQLKEMLDLSDTTLQTMRNSGVIPYTLLGGLAFYDYEEILQLMEKNKQIHRKNSKQ